MILIYQHHTHSSLLQGFRRLIDLLPSASDLVAYIDNFHVGRDYMGQGGINSHKSGANEDKYEHTLYTCSLEMKLHRGHL